MDPGLMILSKGQHAIELEIAGFKVFKIDETTFKIINQIGEKCIGFVVAIAIINDIALRR